MKERKPGSTIGKARVASTGTVKRGGRKMTVVTLEPGAARGSRWWTQQAWTKPQSRTKSRGSDEALIMRGNKVFRRGEGPVGRPNDERADWLRPNNPLVRADKS